MGLGHAVCGLGNKQSKVNSLEYYCVATGNGIDPGESRSLPQVSGRIIVHSFDLECA